MSEIQDKLDTVTEVLKKLSQTLGQNTLHTARMLARSGRYDEACLLLGRQVFTEQGHQLEAVLLLAKISAQQGDFQKASALWQQVLRIDSGNQEAIAGLSAISRNHQKPVQLRIAGFISVCIIAVLLIVGLTFYLGYQSMQLAQLIAATGSNNNDFTLEQMAQTNDHILTLQNHFYEEIAVSKTKLDAIAQKMEQLEEDASRRDQALGDRFAASLSEIQTEAGENNHNFLAKLSTIEAMISEDRATLLHDVGQDIVRLSEMFDELSSAIDELGTSIEDSEERRQEEVISTKNTLETRLKAVEQELYDIRAELTKRKK